MLLFGSNKIVEFLKSHLISFFFLLKKNRHNFLLIILGHDILISQGEFWFGLELVVNAKTYQIGIGKNRC